MNCKVD